MIKLILIIVLAFSLNGYSEDTKRLQSNCDKNVTINMSDDKAPDFALKSIDGKTVKLSDYKGKIVIIDFWATWCPPCRRGIPDLVAIQKEYKDNVVIIGISLDREKTIKDVPGFAKNYGINYPIVYGDDSVVISYGGIQSIPTSFVVDKKGNVVDMHVGLVSKDTFVNKIKELLK
jgi:cytochrome c biogenesis protein CcmG/thiol:disulfide interchange protein DsbE